MLQSMGLQRVGHGLETEQQQLSTMYLHIAMRNIQVKIAL